MILDIETTGLSPKYSQVILVGIIYYQDDKWLLTQIFCDHRSEEKELLEILKDYIQDHHMFITYNGYAFDIPYLNKRYQAHGIDYKLTEAMNFDLYRVVRSSKKALGLDNYKLKTIEEFLGIYREDQISGKESVDLYDKYELSPDNELRHIILLHNSDDIEYMIPTLEILNHVPLDIPERYFPFVLNNPVFGRLILKDYKVDDDYLSLVFVTSETARPYMHYSDSYSLVNSKGILEVKLPLFHIGERQFIDIDMIDSLQLRFNDLDYDSQISLELTSRAYTLTTVNKLLKDISF